MCSCFNMQKNYFIFMLCCAFQKVLGEISEKLFLKSECDSPIPHYISSLIRSANENDPSRYHDVALIRLEIETQSEIFFEILEVIMKQNPENSVIVHDGAAHRLKTSSSFFITVTDIGNQVRKNK